MDYIIVKEKYELPFLSNVKQGEMALVESTGESFVYNGTNWNPVKIENNLQMQLYDMNKQIISQLPALNEEGIKEAKQIIKDYVYSKEHEDDYYMLLCHELKYFTVFASDLGCNPDEVIESVIIDCLNSVGEIKSIEPTEDKEAIEIWITEPEGGTYVMYFFDYGRGIVPCRI